ncbi:MAG: hypothetical protein DRH37_01750 [Deltaproteobacteria bacterium]|nr:MAG: hypothetical protein DRH37_01750 [Deltaproteobacteria bacterium]
MPTEKRKHQRVSTLNLLSYVCVDEQGNPLEQGMGRTLDISEGGILMETHVRIESKYIVLMAVGIEDELIDIKGEVVYSRKAKSGMFESGVRFLEKNEKMIQIVRDLVKTFNQEKTDREFTTALGADSALT